MWKKRPCKLAVLLTCEESAVEGNIMSVRYQPALILQHKYETADKTTTDERARRSATSGNKHK